MSGKGLTGFLSSPNAVGLSLVLSTVALLIALTSTGSVARSNVSAAGGSSSYQPVAPSSSSASSKPFSFSKQLTLSTAKRHQTSIEWTARPTVPVRFLKDPNMEVTVYENKFVGSTLWGEFWDKVNAMTWENHTFKVIQGILKGHRDAAYIDFGSWIGPTLLFASQFCDNIFALEPDPLAFSALVANVNANEHIADRAKLYFECISTQNGPVQMAGNGDSTSRMSGKFKTEAKHEMQKWTVNCRTLPDFINHEGIDSHKLRLIKMDTEGAELFLLPSLKPWLDSFSVKPAIWLSVHKGFWRDFSDEQVQSVWEVISSYRYVYDEVLQPLPDKSNWGSICEFCAYLLTDEPFTVPH